jgi:hypothetical protein
MRLIEGSVIYNLIQRGGPYECSNGHGLTISGPCPRCVAMAEVERECRHDFSHNAAPGQPWAVRVVHLPTGDEVRVESPDGQRVAHEQAMELITDMVLARAVAA